MKAYSLDVPVNKAPEPEEFRPKALSVAPYSGYSQQDLFCPPITIHSDEAKRSHSGAITEQFICPALGIGRMVPSSRYDVNYDGFGHGRFWEIKCVKRTSAIPIYKWRLEKDNACGADCIYAFSTYSGGYAGCDTYEDMAKHLQNSLDELYLLPLSRVTDLCGTLKTYFNNNNSPTAGWNRDGYKEGYNNLPVKRIKEEPFQRVLISVTHLWTFTYRVRINVHPQLKGIRRKIHNAIRN